MDIFEAEKLMKKKKVECSVMKIDEDRQLVFGWFSVIEKGGVDVEDLQNDLIKSSELENSSYDYVLNARVAGDLHKNTVNIGQLVESMVFTKEKQDALGIDLGKVGWWGGFKISDTEVWGKIKKGEYAMFSIGGSGERIPVGEYDGN